MIENVMRKLSLLVLKIRLGDVHNVYQRNGYAMAIQTVLMVLMKIQPCIIVQHLNRVARICSLATTDDALIK